MGSLHNGWAGTVRVRPSLARTSLHLIALHLQPDER